MAANVWILSFSLYIFILYSLIFWYVLQGNMVNMVSNIYNKNI